MAFCMYCGNQIDRNLQFCNRCGKPTGAPSARPAQNTMRPVQNNVRQAPPAFTGIHKYTGVNREFSFVDSLTINVPANKDAFNDYALQFHNFANIRVRSFQQEYRRYCTNFYGYMEIFSDINGKYVCEFLNEAVGLLISCGYYRYTTDDIIKILVETPGFKNLDEFHERNMALGNALLQENFDRAVDRVNNMSSPVFFGTGLGGMAMSFGLSAASGAIQNRKANRIIENSKRLTPAQERDFFSTFTERDVMYHVWDELVQVGNSALFILAENNENEVYFPYQEDIDDTSRLFQNMQNPRFPRNQIPGAAKYILDTFPYLSDLYPFLKQCFGDTPQIRQLENYFYPPRVRRFNFAFPEYSR